MVQTIDVVPAAPWQEIRSTAEDWDALGRDGLLRMLYHLQVIRSFEETILQLEGEGLVHGPAHSSLGQEGGAVGSVIQLRTGDLVTGSHRGHHQFLEKSLKHLDVASYDPTAAPLPEAVNNLLYRTMAEIMGLSPGFCKGRGGSMHLRWAEVGAQGTNAIVGGGVPLATGMAWAKRRQGRGEVVFSFLGDGAINIGAVPESMNLAALWQLPICYFIENNGYAVSTTLAEATHEPRLSSRGLAFGIPAFRVDGMDPVAVHLATSRALDIMRAGQGPTIIEAQLYRYMHHGGGVAGSAFGYRTKEEEAAWRKRDPLMRLVNEMTARKWLNEGQEQAMRGHVQDAVQQAAGRLTEPEGNKRRIVPALWPSPAFRDEGLRGDLSEFASARFEELETASGPLGEVRFIDVVAQVMDRRMACDDRIVIFGEDIHRLRGGTNGATKGLPDKYPGRVTPTPITEQAFSGLGGGLAMEGSYRPVIELMYSDFALVAADQLFNQIAKARHMYGGDTPMPLVLRTKIGIGAGYGAQHSMDPAGLYAMWPGWRIVAPTTPFDYVGLMNSALLCEDPVLVIEHVSLYTTLGQGPLEDFDYCIPLGKAKIARSGAKITVLTYLTMVQLAVQIADEMGVDVEIIDLRSLDRAGLDWETIGASVRKTGNVVVLEQGTLTCSYGAMVTDEIQRRFFDWLDAPVQRIHGGEASPSVSKSLEAAANVSPADIRDGFQRALAEIGTRPTMQQGG